MSTNRPLRIVSLNVLAPELLFLFWRSSYGLPLLPPADYGAVTSSRCTALAVALRALSPDVLLLQEVTDYRHPCLDHYPTAEWFARALGLTLAQTSFKGMASTWGLPPFEQRKPPLEQAAVAAGMQLPGSGGPGVLRADSGVATLYNPRVLRHVRCLGNAEAYGRSHLFPTGWGSPWTLDAFSLVAPGVSGGGGDYTLPPPILRVMNVHMKMQWPNILRPLGEAFSRAGACLAAPPELSPWDHVVVGGDFNAGEPAAAADFGVYFSPLGGAAASGLREVPLPGGGGPPLDRFLVGPGVEVGGGGAVAVGREALLETNTQPRGVKVLDAKLWGEEGTKYAVHAGNAGLVRGERGGGGSDHPTLLLLVTLRALEKRATGSARAGAAPGAPREATPVALAVGLRGAKVEVE